MIRTFRASARLWAELQTAQRRLAEALPGELFRTTQENALELTDEQPATTASKPVYMFKDDRGGHYLFKLADPALIAAEVCAYRVRRLGHKPALPARSAELKVAETGEPRQGVLKPFIEFDTTAQLAPDTTTWTILQQLTILTEHVWEWFLGNLDTNTSQYALLQATEEQLIPLNLDWDRSFNDEALETPTRFDKYRTTLPNAHTFLYADYVGGRIELPLELLLREAKRVRALPAGSLERELRRYAETRFPEDKEQQSHWVRERMQRRQEVVMRFRWFVKRLIAERRAATANEITPRTLAAWAWRRTQLLLHYLFRGPLGWLGRRALRAKRSLFHY